MWGGSMNLFQIPKVTLKQGDLFVLTNKTNNNSQAMMILTQFNLIDEETAVLELTSPDDNSQRIVGELRLNQGFYVNGQLLDCHIDYTPILGEA